MNAEARLKRWDIYDRVVPPWETGRAQPAVVALAEAGRLRGRVLDVGCGTGEHAMLAASLGLAATGIDGAPSAIRIARERAERRGLEARFLLADALDLGALDERWDTVIDCNFFQIFADSERPRYVRSLASVIEPGGHCFVLCFSDLQPGQDGPRRISQAEIREGFADGWRVEAIEAIRLETALHADGVAAWCADIWRLPAGDAGRPDEDAATIGP